MTIKHLDNLVCFCTEKCDGNMSVKYEQVKGSAAQNKKRALAQLKDMPQELYQINIKYKDVIVDVDEWTAGGEIEADAVVTRRKHVFFHLGFADCIPCVIHHKQSGTLAFAHLGWQSICMDLHLKLLQHIGSKYDVPARECRVVFGPCIGKASYVFEQPAQLEMPGWSAYVQRQSGGYHVDLPGYVADQIKAYGVPAGQISCPPADTGVDERFFSHYRSVRDKTDAEGRFLYGAGLI